MQDTIVDGFCLKLLSLIELQNGGGFAFAFKTRNCDTTIDIAIFNPGALREASARTFPLFTKSSNAPYVHSIHPAANLNSSNGWVNRFARDKRIQVISRDFPKNSAPTS